MFRSALATFALAIAPLMAFSQGAPPSAAAPTEPRASFVTVEPGVRSEVLDWGGSGRPLVFLAGAGQDAHVFDTSAPKLHPKHHVYGMTRKGTGKSSVPAPSGDNYSADRLGE